MRHDQKMVNEVSARLKGWMKSRSLPVCVGTACASGIALAVASMLWFRSYARGSDSGCSHFTGSALSQYDGLAAAMDTRLSTNVLSQYNGLAANMESRMTVYGSRETAGTVGGWPPSASSGGYYDLNDLSAEYGIGMSHGNLAYAPYRPNGTMFENVDMGPKACAYTNVSQSLCEAAETARRASMYFLRRRAALAEERLSEWKQRERWQEDWRRMAEVERAKQTWTTTRQEETVQKAGLEWVNPGGVRAPRYEGIGAGDPSLARDRYTGELYRIRADGTKEKLE